MYAEKQQYFTTTLTSLFFNYSYECKQSRNQLCKQFFVKLIFLVFKIRAVLPRNITQLKRKNFRILSEQGTMSDKCV